MTRDRASRLSGTLMMLAGSILLGIVLVGDFTSLGELKIYRGKPGERLDMALVAEVRDRQALIDRAEARLLAAGLPRNERTLMNALYFVTTDRFVHGAAEHTIYSNWPLWLLGVYRETPVRVRDTGQMLARGHAALCGQISQLLADSARELGIEARVIELEGHVVMEAFYDGAWHFYDGDAEVGPQGLEDAPPSMAELIAEPKLLEARYQRHNAKMIPLILSTDDNRVEDLDLWRLVREQRMEVAKYAIPLLIMLLGSWLLLRTRRSP